MLQTSILTLRSFCKLTLQIFLSRQNYYSPMVLWSVFESCTWTTSLVKIPTASQHKHCPVRRTNNRCYDGFFYMLNALHTPPISENDDKGLATCRCQVGCLENVSSFSYLQCKMCHDDIPPPAKINYEHQILAVLTSYRAVLTSNMCLIAPNPPLNFSSPLNVIFQATPTLIPCKSITSPWAPQIGCTYCFSPRAIYFAIACEYLVCHVYPSTPFLSLLLLKMRPDAPRRKHLGGFIHGALKHWRMILPYAALECSPSLFLPYWCLNVICCKPNENDAQEIEHLGASPLCVCYFQLLSICQSPSMSEQWFQIVNRCRLPKSHALRSEHLGASLLGAQIPIYHEQISPGSEHPGAKIPIYYIKSTSLASFLCYTFPGSKVSPNVCAARFLPYYTRSYCHSCLIGVFCRKAYDHTFHRTFFSAYSEVTTSCMGYWMTMHSLWLRFPHHYFFHLLQQPLAIIQVLPPIFHWCC